MNFQKETALKDWLVRNAHNLAATGALTAISVGFGLAWLPLGFIVPGVIVFACLALPRLRG